MPPRKSAFPPAIIRGFMTRKYTRFPKDADDVYCACGCGRVLTRSQRYKNGKYASVECARKVRENMLGKERDIWKVKRACLCGCGQFVSLSNSRRGFPFVDKEHEKKYKFDMYERDEMEKKKEQAKVFKKYCTNYDNTLTKCIACYDSCAAKYRGCYGEYKKTKS